MTISIIVAVAHGGAIGRNGDLLYHISADLKRFKTLTTGHTIIMGRKTFESFPKGPLPDRSNIVITRNAGYSREGITTAHSLTEAISLATDDDNLYIIGGGEIYRQAMPIADELLITEIDAEAEDADTFFPVINPEVWHQVESSEIFTDPRSGVRYRFVRYLRN
ncbi:MAG: dihydrofolate reductase [Lachnoclostridium sp.]|nr:dihydrofolate reductase [Lachnoclostridium sp.]